MEATRSKPAIPQVETVGQATPPTVVIEPTRGLASLQLAARWAHRELRVAVTAGGRNL